MDVFSFLENPKHYLSGLDLLRRHRPKAPIVTILSSGETFYNRKRLIQELQLVAEELQNQKPDKSPEFKGRKRIAKDRLPVELHPAFERQDLLYNQVNHLHPQLDLLYNLDLSKCMQVRDALLDAWKEIEDIYRIFSYWEKNSQILPNKYNQSTTGDFDSFDTLDMIRRRKTLKQFIRRNRQNPEKSYQIKEAEQEIEQLNQYLLSRESLT